MPRSICAGAATSSRTRPSASSGSASRAGCRWWRRRVAAAGPELGGRVAYVVSVGGHHDLERVLRFLIRNKVETPTGVRPMQAHDYGLVVLLYGSVDRFAPEADRGALRDALRASLNQDQPAEMAAAARLTTD